MKKRQSWTEKLERFQAFLDGDEEEDRLSTAEKRALLEARGINVQRTLDGVADRIAALRARERLEAARTEREALLARVRSHAPRADRSLLDRIWESLEALFGPRPQLAQMYLRRFEQASEEDLQSLFEDIQMLREIDDETP
jgi:hypothetical protein